jgi:hypothetical protein
VDQTLRQIDGDLQSPLSCIDIFSVVHPSAIISQSQDNDGVDVFSVPYGGYEGVNHLLAEVLSSLNLIAIELVCIPYEMEAQSLLSYRTVLFIQLLEY